MYKKYQRQEYLISPIFNNESRNLPFRLRTRTVSGVKNDFRGLYQDTPYWLTLLLVNPTHVILTQFLLDCPLLNLTPIIQIPSSHPNFTCTTRQ